MTTIYWPKWIFYGVAGYIGLLYASSVIDKRREKPKVNVVNLGHMIPSIKYKQVTKENAIEVRSSYFKQVLEFQNLIQDFCSEKREIKVDLKQAVRQANSTRPKGTQLQQSSKRSNESLSQHIKIKYVQRNKLVFQQTYLGFLTVHKKLDLKDGCNDLLFTEEGLMECYKNMLGSENRIKTYLYRNEIGREE